MTSQNNFFNNLFCFKDNEEKIDFKTDVIQINIINKILQEMARKKISRSDLAKKLSVSRSYVTQVFSINRPLSLKMIARIQSALNIKIKVQFEDFNQKKISLLDFSTKQENQENQANIFQFTEKNNIYSFKPKRSGLDSSPDLVVG